ncbi:MAG: Ethylene-responsive transcription factor 12, variant 2, partial [Cercozoa sp. M6MM]
MSDSAAEAVEQWRIKNLIKSLAACRGQGTSMISLIVPPGGQLAKVVQKLQEEYGTATNIKSRVNRQSVLAAITTAQERVKRFNTVPTNGLVVYTGEVTLPDGKTKMFAKYFEPFKPINTSLYYCDSRFHTEALEELLSNDQKYGFIVMDGNGTLFGELCGNSRKILQQISVQLPKKHGRGGQSAQRFGRIRQEKRHNYVRKVGEAASLNFIDQKTNKSTVSGIVLAGSAAFKTALYESEHFDQRLKDQVITVVHTSYGGENGFNQAIELAAEALSDVKLVAEKKLISKFMSEIAQDTGKVCFGLSDTLIALENGAAETLIVWEELEVPLVYICLYMDICRCRCVYLSVVAGEPLRAAKPEHGRDGDQAPATGAGARHVKLCRQGRRAPRHCGPDAVPGVARQQLHQVGRHARVRHRPLQRGPSVLPRLWWPRCPHALLAQLRG